MKLTIHDVAHHRNGVSGAPFAVVRFHDNEAKREMIGILFDTNDNASDGRCAILDTNLIAKEVIAFGENSFRGDHYEPDLRRELSKWWPWAPAEPDKPIPIGLPDYMREQLNLHAAHILMGA